MKVPVGGGMPTTIASGQDTPFSIAAYAGMVYWTDSGAGTVVAAPIDGGAPVTLASGQAGPTNLTVDASGVYWINEGCPGTFAAGACEGEGAVMRLARE